MKKFDSITSGEASVLYDSLSVRKCLIETGTIGMSVEDAKNMGKHNLIKKLEPSQIALLKEIGSLMSALVERL